MSASSIGKRSSEKPGQGDIEQIEHTSTSPATKLDVELDGDGMPLPPPPTLSPEQERALWRKIDLRLMPMLSIMYLMSFLDRGNIGMRSCRGSRHSSDSSGTSTNIALTMYSSPYCLFECPANLVLKRFRPTRWLPGITILWGIIMTLMGLVKTYPQLVGARVCLGVAEAGLFPGVVYYLTLWYPRHQLQYRIGLFFGAATLAGAFSGLLAFGISFMSGTAGLLGWSWIFIIEGMTTVLVGTIALLVLVDFPATATFLTPAERAFVIHTKKYDNSSVGEEEGFALSHVWAAFTDWQIWLHILIYMSDSVQIYGISLFLPTIIHGFGYSPAISQLLTVPPYVFATLVLLGFATWSDALRLRHPFVLAGAVLTLTGFAINISAAPDGAKYFATFLCVAGAYAPFPGIVAWLGNNLSGQYKRGVGMALQIGIGNFGGAIAANIFREQDAPRYVLGNALELMFIGTSFVTVPLAVLIYRRINAARAARVDAGELEKYSPAELRAMGDRAPDFRYTL